VVAAEAHRRSSTAACPARCQAVWGAEVCRNQPASSHPAEVQVAAAAHALVVHLAVAAGEAHPHFSAVTRVHSQAAWVVAACRRRWVAGCDPEVLVAGVAPELQVAALQVAHVVAVVACRR